MSSVITMQAPCSLVNRGLNENPRAEKNALERSMFLTGRLTKILRAIAAPLRVICECSERAEGAEALRAGDALLFEMLHLVQRPHLDLGGAPLAHGIGETPRPFQRLLAASHLDQGVAGDQLLALGKGAVDDALALALPLHAPPGAGRLQAGAIEQHAGARQF